MKFARIRRCARTSSCRHGAVLAGITNAPDATEPREPEKGMLLDYLARVSRLNFHACEIVAGLFQECID